MRDKPLVVDLSRSRSKQSEVMAAAVRDLNAARPTPDGHSRRREAWPRRASDSSLLQTHTSHAA